MFVHHSTSLVLSILLTFSATIHCSAAQNEVAASTVYIVPASDLPPTSSCPGDPCLTIDQYVSNSSLRNGILDITLELQPGYHNLRGRWTLLKPAGTGTETGTRTETGKYGSYAKNHPPPPRTIAILILQVGS